MKILDSNRIKTVVVLLCLFLIATGIFANPRGDDGGNGRYGQILDQVIRYIQDNYVDEVDPEKLYEGAMRGIFESLEDPHSAFLTAQELEDLTDTTEGKFGGVGLYISKTASTLFGDGSEVKDGRDTFRSRYAQFVEVISPIEGTPAFRAGVESGDFIIAIDGESTESLNMDEVLSRLRGVPGNKVVMSIMRKGGIEFDVTVVREVIEVPTIRYDLIPGNIGYIRIIRWTPYTKDRVAEALSSMGGRSISSLIIDVRGNPGGLLSSAVDVTNLFMVDGVIVSTRARRSEDNEVFYANRRTAVSIGTPIVVLVDEGSASASEIFSGALKDTDRAILVGTTTYGKGSVQQLSSLGSDGFRLTTARYFTPSGVTIDQTGVVPHEVIEDETPSDEEAQMLQRLYEGNRIPFFLEKNPNPRSSDIDDLLKDLARDGITLEDMVVRRMIRQEQNRTLKDPPVYDLEFDRALILAVELIKGGAKPENY